MCGNETGSQVGMHGAAAHPSMIGAPQWHPWHSPVRMNVYVKFAYVLEVEERFGRPCWPCSTAILGPRCFGCG